MSGCCCAPCCAYSRRISTLEIDRKSPFSTSFIELTLILALQEEFMLVADAYYAAAKIVYELRSQNGYLITRLQRNAVAYEPPVLPEKRGRGRPRKYGEKIQLRTLFLNTALFTAIPSPVYGESNTTIRYLVRDFLWKPVGHKVRFVLVIHPVRGNIILMTTDLTLDPVDVIRTYAQRFKIEVCVQVSNSYYRSILISLLV